MSATGRPARARARTTSPPSPTAPTRSRCARATPRATPAPPPARTTSSTAPAPRCRSTPGPARWATTAAPAWAFSAEAGAELRVPPRARRLAGLRLGGLLEPARRSTSPRSPTAPTPSRSAPPTPWATREPRPARTTSSTPRRRPRPSIDARAGLAEQGHHARVGLHRRARRDASSAASRAAAGWWPTGAPARARARSTSRAARRALHALGARHRRGGQHRRRRPARRFELDTTAPDPPEITAAPAASATDVTPAWEFTGEQGADLRVRPQARGNRRSPAPEPARARASTTSAPSRTATTRSRCRARDAAGNLSAGAHRRATSCAPGRGRRTGRGRPPAGRRGASRAGGPARAGRARLRSPGRPPAMRRRIRARRAPARAASGRARLAAAASVGEGIAGKLNTPERDAPAAARAARGLPGAEGARQGGQGSGAPRGQVRSFPGLLIAMVLCFFGVQNRIDRNDPKLGLAPVFADPDLTFDPPPTKR